MGTRLSAQQLQHLELSASFKQGRVPVLELDHSQLDIHANRASPTEHIKRFKDLLVKLTSTITTPSVAVVGGGVPVELGRAGWRLPLASLEQDGAAGTRRPLVGSNTAKQHAVPCAALFCHTPLPHQVKIEPDTAGHLLEAGAHTNLAATPEEQAAALAKGLRVMNGMQLFKAWGSGQFEG
jgi:hypothetical protein